MQSGEFEYQSDFAKKYYGQGRVLDVRGIAVPDEARARIAACRDPASLERWLVRAVIAKSIVDLFAD